MGVSCINITHPEYKKLVSQVGSNLAEQIYIYYGDNFDKLKKGEEIRKAIKWKSTASQQEYIKIASEIRKYNSINSTSHRFDKPARIGESQLYKSTFRINYLPVNIEQQKLRDTERKQGGVYENRSFQAIIPLQEIQAFDNTYNTTFERDIDFYNGDQALMEQEDYLLATAPARVQKIENSKKQYFEKEIVKVQQELLATDSVDKIKQLTSKLEKLKVELENSERKYILKGGITTFEQVLGFGDRELLEISNLLSKPVISTSDLEYAQKIVDFWLDASDFSTSAAEHPLLDEEEFESLDIREEFRKRGNVAEDLNRKIFELKKEHVLAFVRKYTSQGLSSDEIFKALKDLNGLASKVLWLGRHDDAMIQAISLAIEQANLQAQQSANKEWDILDVLTKAFLPKARSLSNTKNPYDILKQYNKDGKETGNIVNLFSPEFYSEQSRLRYNAFEKLDSNTGKKVKNKEDIKAYFDWVNNNTIIFDVRALIPDIDTELPDYTLYNRVQFTDNAKEQHIQRLKKHLGEYQYNKYFKNLEKKIDKFRLTRKAIFDSIQEEELTDIEKQNLMEEWLKEHSPYYTVDMQDNPSLRKNSKGEYYTSKGLQYTYQVPKKYTDDNKQTTWYDKNFEKIQDNKELLDYHEFIIDRLTEYKKLFPKETANLLSNNTLPTIEKSLMDIFSEEGMLIGAKPFMDKFTKLLTTTDLSKIHTEKDKEIQIQFIKDNKSEIDNKLKIKVIEYKQLTGNNPSINEIRDFRADIIEQLSKEKSWDVTKVMKAYSLMALGYKHKSFIQPQIKLASELFNNRKQIITNKAGEPKINDNGELATEEGLANYKEALEFALDADFYNLGSRKVEGVSKNKKLTSKEKEEKKRLTELQEKATEDSEKQLLQDELDKLGSPITASGVVDSILKYNLILSLGWKLPSAINNLTFGAVANFIEASGGLHYNISQIRKAYLLTTNSIARNTTFNVYEGVNGNALKIRSLMNKLDLIQDSTKEMYDTSNKSSLSKLERFGPLSLQQRTEYLNIAPVMIATMMNFKAKNNLGENINLWEAYDIEGNLKEGYSADIDNIKLSQKILRIIESNHGDYRHKLKIKENIAGRALSQFRTWMFEGFANRFEAEKVDYALSYGLDEPFIRKGRYKSYTQGQLATTGAVLGSIFLPGIGTAIGSGTGYLAGKFFGMQTNENGLSDTLFTLKQLFRKAIFRKTKFDERFSATDAANMRKNMQELMIYVALGLTVLAIAGSSDDDKDKSFGTTLLLNSGTRLVTDIEFYTNPLALEKITQSALPATRILGNTAKWFKSIAELLDEDSENDVFKQGSFKDNSKALVRTGELIPGISSSLSLYRFGDKIFE